MSRILASLVLLIFMVVMTTASQTKKPESADIILKTSIQKADSSGKTVFLMFHASWCSWCKRLDAVLEVPAIKEMMESHYVMARLDVLESGGNIQTLENPGGNEIMKSLGGEKSGLPFYVFVDARGKKIADSNVMPGEQNIGYPGSAEEIMAFEMLLKKTAPGISTGQLAAMVAYLQKKAPH